MMIYIVMFMFLGFCVYTDLKTRKVYNFAVVSAVILGLGLNLFYYGIPGMGRSVLGLIAGFLFLILFYALGWIGAGDVKFMAAAGCLAGAKFILVGGLYGAALGGCAAILILIFEKRLVSAIKMIVNSFLILVTFRMPEAMKPEIENASYLPYTVFLSLGMVLRWVEVYCLRR